MVSAARLGAAAFLLVVLAFCLSPRPTPLSKPLSAVGERIRPTVAPTAPPEVALETYSIAGRRLDTAINLALFAPLGVLVAMGWRDRPLLQFGLGAMAISAGIEILQLTWVTARTPQWSDVVLNTIGAVAGFVVARALLSRREA